MQIPGYRIIRRINHGGMSTVYLAVQLSVGREVALKIMLPVLNADPVFERRFQREANIVGQLSHPNIVSIYDIGCHNNLNYIAMDYLPGGTIHDRMRSGMNTADVLQALREISLALDHVHSKGYVHRDIKPENILFRGDGTAMLTDFGVAKSLAAASRVSDAGTIVGTPHYMSPEQSRGLAIDGRSDLYSLGVVFYEMLVGSVPYQGEDAVAIAIKHLTATIPTLPPHYAVYQHLINRLLAKEPSSRFQSGAELVTAIDIIEETLAGFPTRRTLTNDPSELNAGILLKALLVTSGAAIRYKAQQLYVTLRRKPITGQHSDSLDDGYLDQIDTLEEKRPTLLSARLKDALDHSSPTRHLRRTLLLFTLLLLVAGAGSLSWLNQGQQLPASLQAIVNATALFNGDHSTHTESIRRTGQAVANIAPPPGMSKEQEPSPTAKLTIQSQPTDARVRILNIRERYRPRINLANGRYHIEVSKPGYATVRNWIDLNNQDLTLTYTLKPLHKPGDVFTDALAIDGDGPEMVVIPRGMFLMGKDGDANASPQHSIAIAKNFAVSKYEITFALYDRYAQATKRSLPDDKRWGRADRPVINVSWHDAVDFARWLSEQTGQFYRLATEAEWEYMARAGSQGDFWWGSDEPGDKANCRHGCDKQYSGLFSSKTAPVGQFAANPFGVHDTAGNVAEWVLDCYEKGYSDAATDGRASVNASCGLRSVRGGSANDDHSALYNYARKGLKPEQRSTMIGFRLVREFNYE